MNMVASFKRSRLIRNDKPTVLQFAAMHLRTIFREPCVAFGVVNGQGLLVGAVIFNDYEHRNVEMTIVGPRAFYKDVAREIFLYAFDGLGCERISLTVPEKHVETIKKARKWGWEIEGRKRRYYGDDNAIIMGMLRSECRVLRGI